MNTNEKLQEALTYSDKKISAVPDLFGDDPKKYRGFPNITCAPGLKRNTDLETVKKQAFMKEPSVGASKLDILSDTIMGGTPLNDVSVLHQTTDKNNNHGDFSSDSFHPAPQNLAITSQAPPNSGKLSTSPSILAAAPGLAQNEGNQKNTENSPTKEKVFHERKISSEYHPVPEDPVPNTTASSMPPALKGLHDLREMVDNLEEEVRLFEQETGREETSLPFVKNGKESFGGFTVSILHAVTKLVGYLRDCENRRKLDMTWKQEIFLTLQQQQILIDALTNEVICIQEENRKLYQVLETSQEDTKNQMKSFKPELCDERKNDDHDEISPGVMGSLFDQNKDTSQTGYSHEALHTDHEIPGARSNDDVVTMSEQTTGKNVNGCVKSSESTAAGTTTSDELAARTSLQSKPVSPPLGNISSNASDYCNNQAPELNRIPQFTKQQKTRITDAFGNHYSHHPVREHHNSPVHNQTLHNIDTVAKHSAETFQLNHQSHSGTTSRGELTMPEGTTLNTSEVFTYYNPVVTNTSGNDRTSPSASDNDLERTSVFISRNQTTSPHRRGRQDKNFPREELHKESQKDDGSTGVNFRRQSNVSPDISPVLFDGKLLSDRPGQEKVVVRLPSMWQQDYDKRTPKHDTTNFAKPAVKQKPDISGNGWFALSSHVDSRKT
ncbi:uncharacterized protein LOC114527178 isoform X2 [Dendronephthya gigantea]|nr:uncharacterized protein LOC114527178 isoform X2 [Dendronephthya gigantea]XP_028404618.1 uncharacterized protein LOC114527178 isoform X2 [Dendronephthya gigantea]